MKVILNKKELAKIILKVLSNQNSDHDSIEAEYISGYWKYNRLVSPYSKIRRKWTMEKVISILNILEIISNAVGDNYILMKTETKHGKLTIMMSFKKVEQSNDMYLNSIFMSFDTPLTCKEVKKLLSKFLY